MAAALEVVSRNVQERGRAAGPAVQSLNAEVSGAVRETRRAALRETAEEHGDAFEVDLVERVIRQAHPRKTTMRLPRGVARAAAGPAGLVVWALLNLAMATGLTASLWAREVAPVRKRGPPIFTSMGNLRPVSYVDDLEGFYDAAWLEVVRGRLEEFAGAPQAGGRHDAVLMAGGLLMLLQLRKAAGLRTLLAKADLMHGFDLAWRDAVRLGLWLAGVRGRWWVAADSSLGPEQVRVRLGALTAAAFVVVEFGVGQGRRAGIHLFGVLVRGLIDAGVGAGPGVALGPPSSPGGARSFSMLQFVDDSFVARAEESGVAAAAGGLTSWCQRWRHRFQGGTSKGPAVMAVAGAGPDAVACGTISGEGFRAMDLLDVLGVPIDAELSLRPLLDRTCAKLMAGARRLVAAMADRGFGAPLQLSQLTARVESAALYGAELLASCGAGWPAVLNRVNRAFYEVAKMLLAGATRPWSLGPGGHVRVFLEARLLTRLGTKLTRRVIRARARMLLLPRPSPISEVLDAAEETFGVRTWLSDAEEVARAVGVTVWPVPEPGATPARRRWLVRSWAAQVVDPLLDAAEARWFTEQVGRLADTGLLPLSALLPLRQPWTPAVCWAPWSPTMWKYHKAWMVARLAGAIPGVVWGAEAQAGAGEACALCGHASAGLHHLLAECPAVAALRDAAWARAGEAALAHGLLEWALMDTAGVEELALKVEFVGRAAGAHVRARGA